MAQHTFGFFHNSDLSNFLDSASLGATAEVGVYDYDFTGTLVVEDGTDEVLDGNSSDQFILQHSFSNGVTLNYEIADGNDYYVHDSITVEWDDNGTLKQTVFYYIETDSDVGGDLITYAADAELPPPGAMLTVVAKDSSVDSAEGPAYDTLICFTRGTMILTATGEVAIERLKAGDLVLTRDRGAQPIRWVGARKVPARGALAPITISAGVLGNDKDLRVSPAHRVLLTGWQADILFGQSEVLATARQLLIRDDVFVQEGGMVEYHHLLFDQHEIVTANGAASESLNPSELAISHMPSAQQAEVLALFPELLSGKQVPPARASLSDRDVMLL